MYMQGATRGIINVMRCSSTMLQVARHRPSSYEEEAEEAAAEQLARSTAAVHATATVGRGLDSTRQRKRKRKRDWFGLAARSRSVSGCRGRRDSGEKGATAAPPGIAVIRLRGGDASASSSSSSSSSSGIGTGTKGNAKGLEKEKDDASWGLNLNVFGWGGDSEAEAEAKAEKKRKAKQDMEEAEAREAMRKAREERYSSSKVHEMHDCIVQL